MSFTYSTIGLGLGIAQIAGLWPSNLLLQDFLRVRETFWSSKFYLPFLFEETQNLRKLKWSYHWNCQWNAKSLENFKSTWSYCFCQFLLPHSYVDSGNDVDYFSFIHRSLTWCRSNFLYNIRYNQIPTLISQDNEKCTSN